MLAQLAAERTALAELTATLEQRVEQRTAELMKEVAAREKAQEQLRQAQKMETIGQLTGGVAHDFNNLLMAVMGNLDLLRKRMPDDPRLHRLVDGALQGAERGASLTQRLLAFARQQDLRAVPVDLRALIQGMIDLLERSLGPRVALRLDLPEGIAAGAGRCQPARARHPQSRNQCPRRDAGWRLDRDPGRANNRSATIRRCSPAAISSLR